MGGKSPAGQGTCPSQPPEELPGLQQHPPLVPSTLSPHSPSEPALCQQPWVGMRDPGAFESSLIVSDDFMLDALKRLTSSVA